MNRAVFPELAPDAVQLVLQPLAGQRVERAERLVQQHDRRVVGQHAGDLAALLHAARQLVGRGVGELRRGRPARASARRSRGARAFGTPSQPQAERDVPAHASATGRGSAAGTRRRGRATGAATGSPSTVDLPSVGVEEAGEQLEQRGLAAAGRADDGHELAGRGSSRSMRVERVRPRPAAPVVAATRGRAGSTPEWAAQGSRPRSLWPTASGERRVDGVDVVALGLDRRRSCPSSLLNSAGGVEVRGRGRHRGSPAPTCSSASRKIRSSSCGVRLVGR